MNLEPAEHSARHDLLHMASEWSSHRTTRADNKQFGLYHVIFFWGGGNLPPQTPPPLDRNPVTVAVKCYEDIVIMWH